MRKFVALIPLAALFVGTPAAAQTVTVWQGQAVITNATGCDFTVVGDSYVSVYRPRGVTDNGTEDRLSFSSARGTHLIRVAGADFSGSGSYTLSGVSGRNGVLSGTFTFSSAARTPATSPLPTSTDTVEISGTFNSFFGVTGCTVFFVGNYSKRLD